MPLIKGPAARSGKGKSANIKSEMASGKSQKQAIAIAMNAAGEVKKPAKKVAKMKKFPPKAKKK